MKRVLFFGTILLFLLLFQFSKGQGFENFNNYVGTSGTYSDGTFAGQDGSTWSYYQCRNDRAINPPTPCMGRNRTPPAKIVSGTLHNGCGMLSFDYKQGFSSAVNLDVYVNTVKVGNVTSPGGNSDTSNVHNSGPIQVNIVGDFVLEFIQADNTTSGQVSVDNVTWTAYNTILPEPTNYPSSFVATPGNFMVALSWVDAVGTQPPSGYLVLASGQNNISAPADGVPVPDDPNLSDGSGALNIFQGIQACSFSNLPVNTPYYFAIFPYTNSGTNINYKNDGSWPTASATTPNTIILNNQNFSNYSLAPWTAYNVTGEQVWLIDSIHGIGTPPACAKMTGYSGQSYENEDWLISPAFNFNSYINENLLFQTAKNYTGNDLEVLISNNYDGTGNPNSFTWTSLTASLSPGGWVWTSSGNINISGITGSSVYIAFKYTSTVAESSTWEVDEIFVTGEYMTGIPENYGSRSSVTVFPNPAAGMTALTFEDMYSRDIKILSVLGKVVFQKTSRQLVEKIDLSGFEKGIYFVQVSFEQDAKPVVKKLIVK